MAKKMGLVLAPFRRKNLLEKILLSSKWSGATNLRFATYADKESRGLFIPPSGMISRRRVWSAYAAACILPVLILVLRLQILPFKPGDLPGMALFLVPVLISAYLGGLGPGTLATILGALLCDYFLIIPVGSFRIHGRVLILQWLALITVCLFVTALMEALHRSRNRAGLVRMEQTIILSSISDAVITTDAEGRIDFLNPEAERLTGWQRDNSLGRRVEEVFRVYRQKTMTEMERPVEAVIRQGQRIAPAECKLLMARGGQQIPIEDSISPIKDSDGTLQGVVMIFKDVTERRLAEAKATEHRERFRATFEQAAVGIAFISPEGNFLRVNHRLSEILGYSRLEFLDRNFQQITFPEDLPACMLMMTELLEGKGNIYTLEKRYFRKDGSLVWCKITSSLVRKANDEPNYFIAVVDDVSERKSSEAALRLSKVQLQTAVEIGGMGMWIVDLSKEEVWLDDTALRFWGLSERQQQTFSAGELRAMVYASDRELVRQSRESLLSTEMEKASEFRIVRPDGSVAWLSAKARRERDEEGEMVRWVFVAMDITERKHAEEERMRAQKLEALGTLSGGIAHDFNNILLAINENARLAAQDLGPGNPVQESLIQIQKAGERAKELVKQILAFSRPSDREKSSTLLTPVVQDAIQLAKATSPSSIRFESCLPTNIPCIMGNANQIYQVVVNLITNAVHAIGDRAGRIEIHVCSEILEAGAASSLPGIEAGHYVKLSIRDDGCGMDKTTLDRLFDPFFTTKPQGQGTGLGLAVVHGIIKGHGGTIQVSSEPAKGSMFIVYLPVSKETGNNMPTQGPIVDSKDVEAGTDELSILFVDDEEMLVMLAERAFNRMGHKMEGFTDPHAAIREFQNRPDDFNIVVTDLSMPKFSGFDLAEQVRAVRPGIPIVMTSGYVRPADEERAAQYGVKGIVLKPTSFDDLGHTLERIFRESRMLAS